MTMRYEREGEREGGEREKERSGVIRILRLNTRGVGAGCTFTGDGTTEEAQESILQSWMIAIVLRFILFEPFMIMLGVFMPYIFESAVLGNLCGEATMNTMEQVAHALMAVCTNLTP